MSRHVMVVGGTSGIGLATAQRFLARGDAVTVTGRDPGRAAVRACELGEGTVGLGLDLSRPEELAEGLRGVGRVDQLVLGAIGRDQNTVADYDPAAALRLLSVKLVGYTEVLHQLRARLSPSGAAVLIGGLAMRRPYPGSTTVTTANGGVAALTRTLAVELAPVRVNAVHPAIVGDSPYWLQMPEILEKVRERTPGGRLVTTADVVDAVEFLLDNRGITGIGLDIDAGTLLV